jgi:predicted ATPase
MNIGLALVDLSSGGQITDIFFRGVTQLDVAGPQIVSDTNQYLLIANYNLKAGMLALAMSEHSAAYTYFNYGISFLPMNHWEEHYDLSLELFNLAAKTALTVKNTKALALLCDQVLKMARSPDDMLEASFVSMSALVYRNVITKAVQYGLTVLTSLDVNIPTSVTRDDALSLIISTQATLSTVTDETLLAIRIATDFKIRMAMKFLASLSVLCNPNQHYSHLSLSRWCYLLWNMECAMNLPLVFVILEAVSYVK